MCVCNDGKRTIHAYVTPYGKWIQVAEMTTQWALFLLFITMETYYAAVIHNELKVKVLPFLYRPWGLHEFEAPRISTQSKNEGGGVVSPTHCPSLTAISLTGRVDPSALVWPEDSNPLKMSMITPEIEPATFLLAAHCFNQLSHRLRVIVAHAFSHSPSCCPTHKSPLADLMVNGSWVYRVWSYLRAF